MTINNLVPLYNWLWWPLQRLLLFASVVFEQKIPLLKRQHLSVNTLFSTHTDKWERDSETYIFVWGVWTLGFLPPDGTRTRPPPHKSHHGWTESSEHSRSTINQSQQRSDCPLWFNWNIYLNSLIKAALIHFVWPLRGSETSLKHCLRTVTSESIRLPLEH